MAVETYFVRHGHPTIYKNPSARLLYGVNLRDWLAESSTSLVSVQADAQGVELDGAAFVRGTIVCAWIKGLDTADGAVNSCRFEFVCADGSVDEATIYFVKRPGV